MKAWTAWLYLACCADACALPVERLHRILGGVKLGSICLTCDQVNNLTIAGAGIEPQEVVDMCTAIVLPAHLYGVDYVKNFKMALHAK